MTSPLFAAVKKQTGCNKSEFLELLHDVTRGGADAGFAGFTTYRDTCDFARRHFKIIMDALREDLESMGGADTVAEMVASFKYMKENKIQAAEVEDCLMSKDDESDVGVQVFNTLAWYALEKVAFEMDR